MHPGLAKNECLSRHPAGARLLQIGEQSLAMGLKFRARVVLDIEEHPTGLAEDLVDDLVSCCFEHRAVRHCPAPRSIVSSRFI